ncbi:MAG: cysteine desulfurase family protein [Flavobacteriales bacterium]
MHRVYLDNAATTPMAKEVLDAMLPFMQNDFGNPSSTHAFGRKTKSAIEQTRKKIAGYLNCEPGEIIFTSGGTEADNMALNGCVDALGVKRIITSPLEHHAILHTAEHLANTGKVKLELVKVDEKGHVDLNHLEELLKNSEKTLVTLMHGNNEIGTLLPLQKVADLCKNYHAYFHSDTVQTMGHCRFNLKDSGIHFLTCAAHKFHGPKGVGFLYMNKKVKLPAMIHGGSQERNFRGGTENLYGIVGLGKAFELAYENLEEHQKHVSNLKHYLKEQLEKTIPGIKFNGETIPEKSLYTVLNVCFPANETNSMLLVSLDLFGVAVSGGSACSSGNNKGSHVLAGIRASELCTSIRFSFSRYTTKADIDFALDKIRELVLVKV